MVADFVVVILFTCSSFVGTLEDEGGAAGK